MIDPITHTVGLLKSVYGLDLVMGKNIYIYTLRLRHARKKKKKKLFPITEMTCSMMVEKKNFF